MGPRSNGRGARPRLAWREVTCHDSRHATRGDDAVATVNPGPVAWSFSVAAPFRSGTAATPLRVPTGDAARPESPVPRGTGAEGARADVDRFGPPRTTDRALRVQRAGDPTSPVRGRVRPRTTLQQRGAVGQANIRVTIPLAPGIGEELVVGRDRTAPFPAAVLLTGVRRERDSGPPPARSVWNRRPA